MAPLATKPAPRHHPWMARERERVEGVPATLSPRSAARQGDRDPLVDREARPCAQHQGIRACSLAGRASKAHGELAMGCRGLRPSIRYSCNLCILIIPYLARLVSLAGWLVPAEPASDGWPLSCITVGTDPVTPVPVARVSCMYVRTQRYVVGGVIFSCTLTGGVLITSSDLNRVRRAGGLGARDLTRTPAPAFRSCGGVKALGEEPSAADQPLSSLLSSPGCGLEKEPQCTSEVSVRPIRIPPTPSAPRCLRAYHGCLRTTGFFCLQNIRCVHPDRG